MTTPNLTNVTVAELEAELARRKATKAIVDAADAGRAYAAKVPPVGTWEVTTEGDCEGKTTRRLGTFTGHVADIAATLAPQKEYGLTFTPVKPSRLPPAGPRMVSIHVRVGGIGGMSVANGPGASAFLAAWMSSAPAEHYVASPGEHGAVELRWT